jgi:hypothetical protein
VVLLFTIDAGGGHRAAARALLAAAEEQKAPFELRVESFQQLLLPLDLLKRTTGLSLEAAYNLILRRRLSVLMVPLLRLMHGAIRVRRGTLVRTLAAWLEQQPRPRAVVSVFPNFNGVLRDALGAAHPRRAARRRAHGPRRLPAALLDRARGSPAWWWGRPRPPSRRARRHPGRAGLAGPGMILTRAIGRTEPSCASACGRSSERAPPISR